MAFQGGKFVEDLFADAEYREHLARNLAQRTVSLAAADGVKVNVVSHGARLAIMRYEVP